VSGAIVVKLYRSGSEIRGYVREQPEDGKADTTFPGEEMPPADAFTLAKTHSREGSEIYVELTEGVQSDPNWGKLVN
jgi:hypothetical protein